MLKKEEYIRTVRRPYPPLFSSLVLAGYLYEEYYSGMLVEDFSIKNLVNSHGGWYYSIKELDRGGELAMKSWRDSKYFEFTQKEFDKRELELIENSQKGFKEYCEAYMRYMPALCLVYVVDKLIDKEVREKLSKKVSPEEVDHIMFELNIPLRDNFYKKEEFELVQASDIAQHVEKYKWLHARYGDVREYTVEEARQKLSEIDKDAYLKKYKLEKENAAKAVEVAKATIGKEDSVLIDIFQYVIFYRTHRTDVMNKSSFFAVPMLRVKAQEIGISYEEILLCMYEEVLAGKIPEKAILAERAEGFTTISENGSLRIVSGKESREIEKYLDDEVVDVKEIKGQIACKGFVKGTVKIVKSKADFNKMNDGDILVTSMTTPEFVPAMKKAAAFITDEGGVTCHAAIISREMNKPCIIGTKIATKALKDGDMVEVNADKGIVKIL